MARKKKAVTEEVVVEETVAEETLEPLKQYEIDWDKIAADVREAALLVEQQYEQDDGPLTDAQIDQIKKTARKPRQKKTKETL